VPGAGGGDAVIAVGRRAPLATVGVVTAAALGVFGALAALAALATSVALGAVASGSPLARPLNLTADTVTVDNTGATLVAAGHVVLDYGAQRATADALRLNRAAQTAELSGHVAITGPQGKATGDTVTLTLTSNNEITRVVATGNAGVETPQYALAADSITADRQAQHLVADGHVTAFSAPDMLITGEHLVYDQRIRHGIITGRPVIENKAGRMQGDSIELFQSDNRAVIHGPVVAEVYGATITSALATVNFKTSVAVLTGHVVITRRQGTLQADQVTIQYDVRRMVAVGTTHAHFTDLGDDPTNP